MRNPFPLTLALKSTPKQVYLKPASLFFKIKNNNGRFYSNSSKQSFKLKIPTQNTRRTKSSIETKKKTKNIKIFLGVLWTKCINSYILTFQDINPKTRIVKTNLSLSLIPNDKDQATKTRI